MTAPGYIELKPGRSRFVPVVRPERMVALVLLAGLGVFALARRATSQRAPALTAAAAAPCAALFGAAGGRGQASACPAAVARPSPVNCGQTAATRARTTDGVAGGRP